jgi:hypothetical protein
MTCAEVERVLPEILEDFPVNDSGSTVNAGTFQNAFQIHLKTCPGCSALVSDLKMISGAARDLSDSEEPSPRVWLGIAAQLRAERIIREPGSRALRPQNSERSWGAWWLVPVAAALLAGGAYVISHKTAPAVAQHQSPAVQPPAQTSIARSTPVEATPQAAVVPPPVPETKSAQAPRAVAENTEASSRNVEAEPSADDQQFLSEVSTRAPSMRVTYQNQLQAVNAEIHEVQTYLEQNPGDVDARQHLMDAYQQKALLYQIALDRIQ